ncbi:bifunctional 23S rRNA (guanine(2069)-N(7))-methyltransferase RlmK/23S rRNA (guanine(2445)-N(2))-methyltransferase RlmL, partial [Kaarinaea lacus]
MTSHYRFFATAPKFTENLLLDELRKLGAADATETVGGVSFSADLTVAYQACLWSRIANRVLVNIKKTKVDTPDDLYNAVHEVPWMEHFNQENSFLVNFFSSSSIIQHSQFGAQKCKDAIVDQFRHLTGERPSVDKDSPDITINVHLKNNSVTISLDLSGHSLHQRGYREYNVAAPLKENLAAALLTRANWPELAQSKATLIDPMCGSGTLLIEATCMAANIAPGLFRTDFGFDAWKKHQPATWADLRQQAEQARITNPEALPRIIGFDKDPKAISATQQNLALAGLDDFVHLQQQEISNLTNEGFGSTGLIVTNPPYGKRLSDNQSLLPVYEALGKQLKQQFPGWFASIITSEAMLAKATGLHSKRINKIYNANLLCNIYHFELYTEKSAKRIRSTAGTDAPASPAKKEITDTALENRLKKNIKHIHKWANKHGVECYRFYDADLPEFNFAIDLYNSDKQYFVLQEYAAPRQIDEKKVKARRKIALSTIKQILNVRDQQIFYKQRKRQSGTSQYDKLESSKKFHVVHEANCSFYVNFQDYLDTGLFLDHRTTRNMIQQIAAKKSFLNLFCYTGTASIHAALGGARTTTSVDMSATYIDWCKRNFELNAIPLANHRFIQADCLEWLKQHEENYDLIFLDPPTFSNSRRMDGHFDIQQHYVELINDCIQLLSASGEIIFSTNFKKFNFDESNFPNNNEKKN